MKPASALLVGDYLQTIVTRYPERDMRPDEGFHRVEAIHYLDYSALSFLLTDPSWAKGRAVIAIVHGISGLLILPDRAVRVLTWVNPERAAWDKFAPWSSDFDFMPRDARPPSINEIDAATEMDSECRPEPPLDEAVLYPRRFEDEHTYRLIAEGIYGLRSVPLCALPWPHFLFKCTYREQIEEANKTYNDYQVAAATVFTSLSGEAFAKCPYHSSDWALVGQLALDVLARPENDETLTIAASDQRLNDREREGLLSLFNEPIWWDEGDASVVNGQHRLCALRAANVPACPVYGRYLRDTVQPLTESAKDSARRLIADFERRRATGA